MWRQNVQPVQIPNADGEFRQCFKCSYEAVASTGVCPRCGSPKFLTAANIRTRGIVLIVVGLFIAGFMGAIAVFVGLLVFGSKDPETIRKVNKDIFTFLVIYLLFGAVIMFGLHSILSGIWMIIAGKRNRYLVWIMWALLAVMAVVGGIAEGLASR